MPEPDITMRQDVQKEPSDELLGLERHRLLFILIGIIPPMERNLSVLQLQDTVIADCDSVGISAEILQNTTDTIEGRFTVNYPFFVVEPPPKDFKSPRLFEMPDTAGEYEIIEAFLEMVEELSPE
jgi:hypothetical protein